MDVKKLLLNLYSCLICLEHFVFAHNSIFNNWVKCPSDCSHILCNKYRQLKNFCRAGTVYDACGCCQICAKGEHDKCGGHHGIYGHCGAGLYCYHSYGNEKRFGHCRSIPKRPVLRTSSLPRRIDNSLSVTCEPKCTPDFCSKWPDAVCSAVDNVVIARPCQRTCQHTVCQACYFKTRREPPCSRCGRDDFDCMRKFSKCVRRDTCTRHKFPCEPHQKKRSDGRFVCKVPACLDDVQTHPS